MVGHTYSANPEVGYQFKNHKTVKAKVYLFSNSANATTKETSHM
jgi:hypothetical protein